jgi:hypothetical protein
LLNGDSFNVETHSNAEIHEFDVEGEAANSQFGKKVIGDIAAYGFKSALGVSEAPSYECCDERS